MSGTGRAVFLSYASQDAEAAKRIADALRASGVEVWFDAEGGLEHGDAWDAKIRRQIKECVLFIPLISTNTQEREEGYFRLEWDLAAERSRTIATGVAFILPVVIDGTREPDALVPDRFRAVQWTKLPGGAVPPEVLQRFLKLWSHRTGVLKHAAAPSSAAPDGPTASRSPRRRVVMTTLGVAVLAVALAAGAFFLSRSTTAKDTVPPVPAATPSPESLSEARKLAQRARAVFDATTVVRQDMELAEQLVQKAEALDPTDAYVWAVAAQVDAGFVLFAYDPSDTRVGQALAKAERAFKMAPDLFETRLAKAFVLTYSPVPGSPPSPEASRLVEGLLKEQPANRRVLLIQGMIFQGEDRWDEAARTYRLAHDRWAEGWALLYAGRLAEVEAVAEEGFKAGQANGDRVAGAGDVRQALMLLLSLNLRGREDLKAAQAVMDRMPPDELREDETACYAADLFFMQRKPEKALEIMRALPRDWLVPRSGEGPYKAVYSALAQQMANHPEAAAIEWRAALNQIEERLVARPNAPGLVLWKAQLLAYLGERAEATRLLQLFEQLEGRRDGRIGWDTVETYLLLDRREEVIEALPQLLQIPFFGFWNHAYLRYDPRYDSLRGDSRFEKILRETAPGTAQPFPGQGGGKGEPKMALPPVDDKSVAVLAFANLSDDKANEYFSDGISEELLNVLAKVPGLKVSARTSAFYFKGKDTPIPEIAQKLGVAYVVEGSVRKQGDKVRITAQLIKAADGFHVWSDTFTRDIKDVFAVQDEIAGLIAQSLSLKLGTSSLRKVAAVNPQAFELYVQARQAWSLRTPEGFARAEQMLNRALELAPDFVRARAALIDVVQMRRLRERKVGSFGQRHAPEIDQRLVQVRGVLAVDPDLAEAYSTLGQTLDSQWQREEAGRAYRRATELNPNYATGRHWFGMHLAELGDMDEALAELKAACDLDPFSFIILDNYGWLLNLAGRNREAVQMLDRAAALNPGFDQTARAKATALAALGRNAEAEALARQLRNFQRELDVWTLGLVGLHDEARTLLQRMDPRDVTNRFQALLAAGQREAALAALADPSGASKGDSIDTLFQPIYDPVRTDPRFLQYLSTLGLAEAHARAQAWRRSHPPEKPEAGK